MQRSQMYVIIQSEMYEHKIWFGHVIETFASKITSNRIYSRAAQNHVGYVHFNLPYKAFVGVWFVICVEFAFRLMLCSLNCKQSLAVATWSCVWKCVDILDCVYMLFLFPLRIANASLTDSVRDCMRPWIKLFQLIQIPNQHSQQIN